MTRVDEWLGDALDSVHDPDESRSLRITVRLTSASAEVLDALSEDLGEAKSKIAGELLMAALGDVQVLMTEKHHGRLS